MIALVLLFGCPGPPSTLECSDGSRLVCDGISYEDGAWRCYRSGQGLRAVRPDPTGSCVVRAPDE